MTIKLTSAILKAFNVATEFCRDVKAAFAQGAMPDNERHLREAEIVAGAGEIFLAPEAPGGAFMIGDAVNVLAKAGHKARYSNQHLRLEVF